MKKTLHPSKKRDAGYIYLLRPNPLSWHLSVAILMVPTVLAIGLLPHFLVGDGLKSRATASHSSIAVLALHVELCCLVIVSTATVIVSAGKNRHRCHQGHSQCKTDNQLLHFSIHCFVSCATSNWLITVNLFVFCLFMTASQKK